MNIRKRRNRRVKCFQREQNCSVHSKYIPIPMWLVEKYFLVDDSKKSRLDSIGAGNGNKVGDNGEIIRVTGWISGRDSMREQQMTQKFMKIQK